MIELKLLEDRLLRLEKALGLIHYDEIGRGEDVVITQNAKKIFDWLSYASSEINQAEKRVITSLLRKN